MGYLRKVRGLCWLLFVNGVVHVFHVNRITLEKNTLVQNFDRTLWLEESPRFRIIVLVNEGLENETNGDNSEPIVNSLGSLSRLLESIAETDFDGDQVGLEVRISWSEGESDFITAHRARIHALVEQLECPSIVSINVTRGSLENTKSNRSGSLTAWTEAWQEYPVSERALVLDSSIQELSPFWYRYVKTASTKYFSGGSSQDPKIAGISLTKQYVSTSFHTPARHNEIQNNHKPFLYPLVVGPQAFVPEPTKWKEFLQWVQHTSLKELQKEVPNLAFSLLKVPASLRSQSGRALQSHSGDLSKPSILNLTETNIKRIYFYHTRKAGGSSLRRWLEKVTSHYKLGFDALEGYVCPSRHHFKSMVRMQAKKYANASALPIYDKENTLSITVIRDPVERIVSSYNFEGRWKQGETNRTTLNAQDMDTWMRETLVGTPHKYCMEWHFCWTCVSNCYGHWFGRHDDAHAREVLGDFDIVLHTDDLEHESFIRVLQRMLGVLQVRLNRENMTFNPRRSRPPKVNPTPEQQQQLEQLNHNDSRLVHDILGERRDANGQDTMQDWFDMLEEETAWTLWTQLFTYWCQIKGYYVFHVSPAQKRTLAVAVNETMQVLSKEDLSQEFQFPEVLDVFDLDGEVITHHESDELKIQKWESSS